MKIKQVIESAREKLVSMGYKPTNPYEEQLDCIINGIAFAIYGDDEDRVFGYGCIFEPQDEAYGDGYVKELEECYKGDYAPFEHLYTCEDGFVHLEGESEVYTDGLIEAIVKALSDPEGIGSKIKSNSYVWEEK